MTARPSFDHTGLDAAFGSQRPAEIDRGGRVRLLAEVFTALLEGRQPSREAAHFLARAGLAWLREGGSLERDHLGVVKAKSHRTPSAIYRELIGAHQDERQPPARREKM